MTKSDSDESFKPVIKIDGSIPLWGVVLIVIGAGTYGWTELRDLHSRLAIRETQAVLDKEKLIKLENQQQAYTSQLSDLNANVMVVQKLLERIEKRLDRDKT